MSRHAEKFDAFAELDREAQVGNWRLSWTDSFCDAGEEFDFAEVDRIKSLVQNIAINDWERLRSALPQRSNIWCIRMFEAFVWAESIEGIAIIIPRLIGCLLSPDYEETYGEIASNLAEALKIIPPDHPAWKMDISTIHQLKNSEQKYVGYRKAINDLCERCSGN